MDKTKRLLVLLLAFMTAMTLGLAGCGQSEAPQEEDTAEAVQDTAEDAAGDAAAGGYDIMDGFEKKANEDGSIEYLYFNGFMMVMPGNETWSFEASPEGDSVAFYHYALRQEGSGGRLVTIQAYDADDMSYEELPVEYHVAGTAADAGKRFIAIYPSDVQYDPGNEQQAAEYKDLYDYLHKIGEDAVNSPLQTADSNTAQE